MGHFWQTKNLLAVRIVEEAVTGGIVDAVVDDSTGVEYILTQVTTPPHTALTRVITGQIRTTRIMHTWEIPTLVYINLFGTQTQNYTNLKIIIIDWIKVKNA